MKAEEIKKHLNNQVTFRDSTYKFIGAIFRKNDKGYYYQAELLDKCDRSICIANLEDVEV